MDGHNYRMHAMSNQYTPQDEPIKNAPTVHPLSLGLISGTIAGVVIGFALAMAVSTLWGEVVIRWGMNGR